MLLALKRCKRKDSVVLDGFANPKIIHLLSVGGRRTPYIDTILDKVSFQREPSINPRCQPT